MRRASTTSVPGTIAELGAHKPQQPEHVLESGLVSLLSGVDTPRELATVMKAIHADLLVGRGAPSAAIASYPALVLALARRGPIAAGKDMALLDEVLERCLGAARYIGEPTDVWNAIADCAQHLEGEPLRHLQHSMLRHAAEVPFDALPGFRRALDKK